MVAYTIVPRRRAYWIEQVDGNGGRPKRGRAWWPNSSSNRLCRPPRWPTIQPVDSPLCGAHASGQGLAIAGHDAASLHYRAPSRPLCNRLGDGLGFHQHQIAAAPLGQPVAFQS
jgi:hypothetical protein